MIRRCVSVDEPGWLALREALWPECPREEHLTEMACFCANPERHVQFVAYPEPGIAAGLVEAAIRTDHVNGTHTAPVAFLEGLYVIPEARRQGIARALVAEVERWAVDMGCRELASDALLENQTSHAAHRALGFEETKRVVFFRKALKQAGSFPNEIHSHLRQSRISHHDEIE